MKRIINSHRVFAGQQRDSPPAGSVAPGYQSQRGNTKNKLVCK